MTSDPLSQWRDLPAPADRPRRSRRAVRIIMIDASDRILLFQDSDPGADGYRWWMTPGGGIDPGETEIQAAVREIAEETGLAIQSSDLIGPVATRTVLHGFSDQITEQHETFYILLTADFDVDISGHTDEEQVTVQQYRWWPMDLLRVGTETLWPAALLDIHELKDRAADWPVDLGTVEESSVGIHT